MIGVASTLDAQCTPQKVVDFSVHHETTSQRPRVSEMKHGGCFDCASIIKGALRGLLKQCNQIEAGTNYRESRSIRICSARERRNHNRAAQPLKKFSFCGNRRIGAFFAQKLETGQFRTLMKYMVIFISTQTISGRCSSRRNVNCQDTHMMGVSA
jgi:hypothetical protein